MIRRSFLIVAVALTAIAVTGAGAFGQPHVFVTMKSEVLYAPDGTVTGVQHSWTFDEMFSALAIQGLQARKKGEFTREELAPLADVNVNSLKEYAYFPYAEANGKKLEFSDPLPGYYLDFDNQETVLTLHFTLPLKAKGLVVNIYDLEFFIDFTFAEKEPAKPVGAPLQCELTVRRSEEIDDVLLQWLSELAFAQKDAS